jgi:proline iminopeptidase
MIVNALVALSLATSPGTNGPNEIEWRLPRAANCSVYVREMGEGSPLIVIHGGWGLQHEYLAEGLNALAQNYRLIFYDQRGSLRSNCDGPSTIEAHIGDLHALIEELDLQSASLFGHSMGGFLAARFLAEHPGRVDKLVLAAPTPPRSGDIAAPAPSDLMPRYLRETTLEALAEYGLEDLRTPEDPRLFGIHRSIAQAAVNLADARRWREIAGQMDFADEAARQSAASMPEAWDYTADIEDWGGPVLVIVGTDDFIPYTDRLEWTHAVPGIEIEVIDDAGHIFWIDRPEDSLAAIRAFLDASD